MPDYKGCEGCYWRPHCHSIKDQDERPLCYDTIEDIKKRTEGVKL